MSNAKQENTMTPISYNTTNAPTENGVYACRVPYKTVPKLYADVFLVWYGRHWGYCGSALKYSGEVSGWIGPLQRHLD